MRSIIKRVSLNGILIIAITALSTSCGGGSSQSIEQTLATITAGATAPVWENWHQNIIHAPTPAEGNYYFMPTSYPELEDIVRAASSTNGQITIRVSGQRHAQAPLIIADSRNAPSPPPKVWLIDLSCYADLGATGTDRMILDKEGLKITVNAGVREDELDSFLTANNLMLKTVTAGGFFSVGGMTAVDVHGATVNATDFPGTVASYTMVLPDGTNVTIDESTPGGVDGFKPIQFARVSLGALGIITSVTFNVERRPYKKSLVATQESLYIGNQSQFITNFKRLLFSNPTARVEAFHNAHTLNLISNTRVLSWSVDSNPSDKTPNVVAHEKDACQVAHENIRGAPTQGGSIDPIAISLGLYDQRAYPSDASILVDLAMDNIRKQMDVAIANNTPMWLTNAAKVLFMSYTIPLPNNADNGLDVAWAALNVVRNRVQNFNWRLGIGSDYFNLSAPIEFRFIRGGDALLGGTYSTDPNQLFIGIEIIGWYKPKQTKCAADESLIQGSCYQKSLLNFFAKVECDWAKLGGIPHQGKAYGFFEPTNSCDTLTVSATGPFNKNYIAHVNSLRGGGKGVAAFSKYRQTIDPVGVFCNAYLKLLGICPS